MKNIFAGHANSYHGFDFEQTLDGISKAGMANGHTGFFEQLGRDRLFGEASRGLRWVTLSSPASRLL